MKIALIQLNTLVGDIAGNTQKVIRSLEKAQKEGAKLAIFQEMVLTGYPPRDLLYLPYFMAQHEEALKNILPYTQGIACVLGGIVVNKNVEGLPLYNAAFWCQDGTIREVARKRLLPMYDVFDENRYFEPGQEAVVVAYQGYHFGLSICEDIWRGGLYSVDPVSELKTAGAQVLINISASPYSCGKIKERRKILSQLSSKYFLKSIYVNQVGGNDELVFDGGSMIYNAQGDLCHQSPFFKEDTQVIDLDHLQKVELVDDELNSLEQALILGLKDYVKKCGFKKVALGLSGGIDSALVATLAAKALGKDHVLGLMMPSRYSSKGSVADSKKLAKNLGIKTKLLPIDGQHKAYEKSFKTMFRGKKPDTTEENIQARIRGNLLMAVSNKLGHLVLTTGNKSEVATGYCTLYGDMAGGLAVISDVPKTLVYDLCRYINRKKEIIPQTIIDKEPSAELRPNQRDQDSLPPYEVLDKIMRSYVEDLKSEEEIIAEGHDAVTVKRIIRLIKLNEYKRRQAAPGLKVTSKAFGVGRRFPIAAKF
ncbi:NAD+ synthase [bacterium]|nr:NAD+ synthase [bacterium]